MSIEIFNKSFEAQKSNRLGEFDHPGPYTGGVQGGSLAPPFQINDIQLAHLKISLH